METPERIGKYEVTSQIATGGFGVIYKGWDPFIKRTVAIKMCATPDVEVRQRFQREAEFVGNLVHPNITLIFDFGIENDIPYLVQEFLTGFDLDEVLNAGVLNEPRLVIATLVQICDGLEFAHHRGIVHRDMKPSNIRVLQDGVVKIMDFGIAKSLEGGTKLTQTGIALGTAGYLAPEQIQGKMVDPRTDIFSLGVVAYELITGIRPFEGSSLSNVLYRILNDVPKGPRQITTECSPQFEEIIERCMAKEPEDRYQTVDELGAALRTVPVDDDGSVVNDEIAPQLLQRAMAEMTPSKGSDSVTRTSRILAARQASTPTSSARVAGGSSQAARTASSDTFLHHSPESEVIEKPRRNIVLITFLTFVAVLLVGAGVLYFSPQAQRIIFGQAGAPWVPTATPTPTVTPTPSPTATPTPIFTPTPAETPTPLPPTLVTVRLVVYPPALVEIDGQQLDSSKVATTDTRLRVGRHTFEFALPDYPELTSVVTREVTNATKTISLVMDTGFLTVMSDPTSSPPGGVAYLGGAKLGKIPFRDKLVPATGPEGRELVVRWGPDVSKFSKNVVIPKDEKIIIVAIPSE